MKKIEMSIRAICWMLWMLIYVLLAMWVGQGTWDDNFPRFIAALFGIGWAVSGGLVIEVNELPENITNALLEDEQ